MDDDIIVMSCRRCDVTMRATRGNLIRLVRAARLRYPSLRTYALLIDRVPDDVDLTAGLTATQVVRVAEAAITLGATPRRQAMQGNGIMCDCDCDRTRKHRS